VSSNRLSLDTITQRVGDELGVSTWVTLDQSCINEFAHCTGDDQWIHVDPDRAARESPFGSTIAHGYLTLALIGPAALEVWIRPAKIAAALNYGSTACASSRRFLVGRAFDVVSS